MSEEDAAYSAVLEGMYAKAIGEQVLTLLKKGGLEQTARMVESDAVHLLERVRAILDDQTLDDPECFRRIEALVDAFGKAGVRTSRHDW